MAKNRWHYQNDKPIDGARIQYVVREKKKLVDYYDTFEDDRLMSYDHTWDDVMLWRYASEEEVESEE